MQITLNQDEIVNAIKDYVRKQIVVSEGMEINVDLKAGRGDNGYTATLDIAPAGDSQETPAENTKAPEPVSEVSPKKTRKPAQEKEEVSEETVEEEVKPEPVAEAKEDTVAEDEPAAGSIFNLKKG